MWTADIAKDIDTPALLVDLDMVKENIALAIKMAGGTDRFRPHVKTHKTLEIAKMQLDAGIYKFKCATIAEAEMLGMAGALDVLIAYPIQGPKIDRVIQLIQSYPKTQFSFLVDFDKTVDIINKKFKDSSLVAKVFIDINNGQNRTGIKLENAFSLIQHMKSLEAIKIIGIHCYDGHLRSSDYDARKNEVIQAFEPVQELHIRAEKSIGTELQIVVGGSPSFPIHAVHHDVQCSPGTWIFWDQRYGEDYPEQPFNKAAVVATRIISKIDAHTYCTDLGHKSIASESPFPRVSFLSDEKIMQIGHSEEHLVIRTENPDVFSPGDLLLAFPFHICPTVALYNSFHAVKGNVITGLVKVTARMRKINI